MHRTHFQREVIEKVGFDALKLGLLMGTEDDPREEEQQEVLSLHHLLIMEFIAGKYISTLSEVGFDWLLCSLVEICPANLFEIVHCSSQDSGQE